jgi:3-hydroxybutyryl-CoA dehydratase
MESPFKLSELSEGTSLPEIKHEITREKIRLYAEASGDYNPIHIDEEFARQTPAGGIIAHGMLILAYISELMTSVFGQGWLHDGKLDVRFRAPARPGDVIKVSGKIHKIEIIEADKVVTCDVLCSNQKDEAVINGEAKVRVKDDENIR